MKALRRLLGCGKGTAAVEFALTLPLILLLVFSVVELGSAWYYRQMMVNASREGARLGALFTTGGDQQVVDHVTNVLTQAGFPGQIQVSSIGADLGAGALVQVDVTSQYTLDVLGKMIPGVPENITLSATTVMRHE